MILKIFVKLIGDIKCWSKKEAIKQSVGWVFTQQNDSLQIDSSGAVVLDFRVVDFLDYTFRLRLCRSVAKLLLTSSLALLDSTLPKIRQNDGKGVVILRL